MGEEARKERWESKSCSREREHQFNNTKNCTGILTIKSYPFNNEKQNLTVFIFISSILENSVYFAYLLYFFFGKVSIQILCLFLYLRQWNKIWLIVNTINSWRTLCFVEFLYCLGYISWLFRFNDYYSFFMPILYYHNYCCLIKFYYLFPSYFELWFLFMFQHSLMVFQMNFCIVRF